MSDISMRRITEVGGVERPGFQVRFYGDTKDKAWFSSKKLGRDVALKKAKSWRNKRERELGLSSKDYGHRRPRTKHANSKGFTGVFISVGSRLGRFYADVVAVLNYTTEAGKNKRTQKSFSILKHGYHMAYVLAVQERCAMANLSLPDKVEVPELELDQIQKIVSHSDMKKSDLYRTVEVPWTTRSTTTRKL